MLARSRRQTATSSPRNAKGVTINLTAVVDLVDNPRGVLVGSIAPGDVITGSYTYNPKTKDMDPSAEVGFYPHNQPSLIVLQIEITNRTRERRRLFACGPLDTESDGEPPAYRGYD